MSRAFARITAKLPKGWGDAGRQIGILVGVDIAYELVRGIADSQRSDAIAHGAQVIDFERSTHTFFEPSLQAFFLPAHWVIDLANQLYLNAQFSIALGFLVWLYLFRNESYYFVRNMFVVSMGLALVGYVALPDRAAADVPPARLRRHDRRLLQRQPRLGPGEDLHQPLRGGAEHALRLRADDRRHRRHGLPPLVLESLLGRLAAADRLGRDRHRQPLLGRRGARLDGRRDLGLVAQRLLARARPEAWAWRSRIPREAEA